MSINSIQELEIDARNILARQPIADKTRSFIELLYQPTFENEFLFQLTWENQDCRWQRLTWLKLEDQKKYETIESLKFIGEKINPTIVRQNGKVSADKINSLIQYIETLKMPIVISQDKFITLDGVSTRISFGNSNWTTTYEWTTLPYNLKDLEGIIHLLLRLNKEIDL